MRLTPRSIALVAMAGAALALGGCQTDENKQVDLTIPSAATAAPAAPVAGDTITVTVPISNAGSADAGAFSYTVNRDGVPDAFSGQASTGLAAGASGTFTFTVQETASGSHTYIILINPSGGVSESNYQNNSTTLSVTFSAVVPPSARG